MLSKDDKILTSGFRIEKGYGTKKVTAKFPEKKLVICFR